MWQESCLQLLVLFFSFILLTITSKTSNTSIFFVFCLSYPNEESEGQSTGWEINPFLFFEADNLNHIPTLELSAPNSSLLVEPCATIEVEMYFLRPHPNRL